MRHCLAVSIHLGIIMSQISWAVWNICNFFMCISSKVIKDGSDNGNTHVPFSTSSRKGTTGSVTSLFAYVYIKQPRGAGNIPDLKASCILGARAQKVEKRRRQLLFVGDLIYVWYCAWTLIITSFNLHKLASMEEVLPFYGWRKGDINRAITLAMCRDR